MFTRISKQEAFRRFSKGETIVLCPRKLRPGFPFGLHSYVDKAQWVEHIVGYENNPKLWNGTPEKTAWECMYNNWANYNVSWEAGYYPHYYIET
jgi:hypothetical protein